MIDNIMPFYKLWTSIESEYTSCNEYLDKLYMELIGYPSSRCPPPTMDMRNR
jgi:4-hydroxy-tetrahydrodipicolinate synthase